MVEMKVVQAAGGFHDKIIKACALPAQFLRGPVHAASSF
jgi:hypothetical protein